MGLGQDFSQKRNNYPTMPLTWQSGDTPSGQANVAERLYVACMNFLTNLLLAYGKNSEETCFTSFKECRRLLYLWGEGLNSGKLERAFSHSDDLQDSVLELLISIGTLLGHRLSKASEFDKLLNTREQNLGNSVNELQSLLAKASLLGDNDKKFNNFIFQKSGRSKNGFSHIQHHDNGFSGSNHHIEADLEEASEDNFQEISDSLLSYVECLMNLLPSFEITLNVFEASSTGSIKPLPTDTQETMVPRETRQYVRSIMEKFPQADKILVERLGEANFQRYIRLQDKPNSLSGRAKGDPNSKCQSSPSFQDDSVEETTSIITFASNLNENEDGSLRVPTMPRELRIGKSFTCKFCKRVLNDVRDKRSWILHIYDDLQPYVCTFVACKDESRTYPTRKLWANHQRTQHFTNTTWVCDECNDEFEDYLALENHFQEVHNLGSQTPQLRQILEVCKRQELKQAKDQKCPLCSEIPGSSWKAFEKHLGRHLESIALAVLSLDDDSDSGTESSVSHGSEEKRTKGNAGGAIQSPINSGSKIETETMRTSEAFAKESETSMALLMAQLKVQIDAFEKERAELRAKRALEEALAEVDKKAAKDMALFRAKAEIEAREKAEAAIKAKTAANAAAAVEAAAKAKAEDDAKKLIEMQAQIDADQKALDELRAEKTDKKKPIHFNDAIRRQFSFPYEMCATWEGMEALIRQAFFHIDVLGPLVATRQYDLVGPNDRIILPQIWETMIEPDLTIHMRMWPQGPEPKNTGPLPTAPNIHGRGRGRPPPHPSEFNNPQTGARVPSNTVAMPNKVLRRRKESAVPVSSRMSGGRSGSWPSLSPSSSSSLTLPPLKKFFKSMMCMFRRNREIHTSDSESSLGDD